MYIPDHFRASDDDVRDLLANLGAAELITATGEGLLATYLPLLYDPPGDDAPVGRLMGHVARSNRQWKVPALGDALVVARGPDAYISPTWYATKREHGRVVPTWNYVTAHIRGTLVVHDDRDWVEANVRALTARHESGRAPAWGVDDAPGPYIEGQLRAIVGVEIRIAAIEAKLKLSQNRSKADVEGAIDGLLATERTGAEAMAREMQRVEDARTRS